MRTTLELDDRVVAVARSRAQARGTSLGRAVSELALAGLEAEHAEVEIRNGFPVLHAAPGHVITDELVAKYRDD